MGRLPPGDLPADPRPRRVLRRARRRDRQRIDELADYLAGDDQHGEGYLAKVARLTAARDHAKERVLSEYLLLPPDEDRPTVVDRGHPSWAEVDAEQRERLGDLPAEGRS